MNGPAAKPSVDVGARDGEGWRECVCRAAQDDPRLVFFAPDVTEISTIKRVSAFLDNGLLPLVLGFRRERCNRNFQPTWPHLLLGHTSDGRHWRRLLALVAAFPKIFAVRKQLRDAGVFYARNIDLLILALVVRRLFNARVPVVYEVLDIQPALCGAGVKAAVLRWIERRCLDRIDLLVLSSPGFLRHYFVQRQRYGGRWILHENKLHRSSLAYVTQRIEPRVGDTAASPRWSVGYFGLIRGKTTMLLMRRIADRLRDKVLFRFRGVFTTVDERLFHDIFRDQPNVVYEGEYAHPQDLGTIYGGVDFAWAIDLEDAVHNSRWLLPNRFYEAGLCSVPCLAVDGFELGSLIDELGIGWSFAEPLEESLVAFFEGLTPQVYNVRQRRLQEMPKSRFIADDDAECLCRLLRDAGGGGLAKSRSARAPVPAE
jgi:succinoglycan biosynthesis protein ExoL